MTKIQYEDAQSVKRVRMGLIHLSSLRSRLLSRSDAQCVKMEGMELVVDELGQKVQSLSPYILTCKYMYISADKCTLCIAQCTVCENGADGVDC